MKTDEVESDGYELFVKVNIGRRDGLNSDSYTKMRAEAQTENGKDDRNENRIDNCTFFIFKSDGELIKRFDPNEVTKKTEANYLLKVPYNEARQLYGGSYRVLMVANCDVSANITNYDDLSKLVFAGSFNTNTRQDRFVMIGSIEQKLDFSNVKTIRLNHAINLTRLAAKFRFNYPVLPKDGYLKDSRGDDYQIVIDDKHPICVMISGVCNKTFLKVDGFYEPDDFDQYRSSIAIMGDNLSSFDSSKQPIIYYSYPFRWGEGQKYYDMGHGPFAFETVYCIYVRPKGSNETPTRRYFRLSVSTSANPTDNQIMSIESNVLYDIKPVIEEVAPTIEDMIEVKGSYSIKEWTVDNLDYNILDANYFVVKEHDVHLANVEDYQIDFVATRNVHLKEIGTVTYERYIPYNVVNEKGGKKETITIRKGEDGYPEIKVNNYTKKIEVKCKILKNYAPKYFNAVFEDEGGLQEFVRFVQYPPQYVSGVASEPDGLYPDVFYSDRTFSTGQTNFNIFRVRTLTPSVYRTGDPTYVDKDGIIRTKTDAESNKLISPDFVIASQRGIYSDLTMYDQRRYSQTQDNYEGTEVIDGFTYKFCRSAEERCAKYGEGGYPPGTWRLPTLAELRFIDRIQDDPNSAVKSLLMGRAYWSAEKYAYYRFLPTNTYEISDIYSDEGVHSMREPWVRDDYYNSNYFSFAFTYDFDSFIEQDGNITYTMYQGYYYVRKGDWGSHRYTIYKFQDMAGVRCVHDVY
ncbi:fimbrial protein [Falsiporphyromonas endometrii]|uniref:Fimbrial protein n=1 Tax=Falsiporphyromonas endometrii TaxID=1387297 RepID=A0ABV9K7D0_9PORP